jgi:hypothetical protein
LTSFSQIFLLVWEMLHAQAKTDIANVLQLRALPTLQIFAVEK